MTCPEAWRSTPLACPASLASWTNLKIQGDLRVVGLGSGFGVQGLGHGGLGFGV